MPQRIALIGYGRSGRDIHRATLDHMKDHYIITAGVELDADRRAMMTQEIGCPVYAHFTELYARNDIDLVVNASYSHMHIPITQALLEHGFHVLSEKPAARTAEEVQALINTAEKHNRTYAIFQQSRYAPYFQQVKQVIDSGVLGDIMQINIAFNGYARRWDWQCLQAMNGGSLYNTGPHPMDQALRLLNIEGMPQVTARLSRANTYGDAEDYVKVLLSAPDRPIIDLEISSCCAYDTPTYQVQGTRGGLRGTMQHIDWRFYDEATAPHQALQVASLHGEGHIPLYCGEKLGWHEHSWDIPETQKDMFQYMTLTYYHMLYRHLTQGTPLEITPQQVKQQIAVMEECHRQSPLSRMDVVVPEV